MQREWQRRVQRADRQVLLAEALPLDVVADRAEVDQQQEARHEQPQVGRQKRPEHRRHHPHEDERRAPDGGQREQPNPVAGPH